MGNGTGNIPRWPGWKTNRLIGRGSYGAVYEIERDVFGDVEKAALKVISIPQNESDIDEFYMEGYSEADVTETFRDHLKCIVAEYSLMRKLNGCSNIVHSEDIRYVEHEDGIGWDIFIKMELLTPLMKALPLAVPEDTVVKIAKDMCVALELCRKHGIIHRDIKPQNIFVSPHGDYKLGDFGIAKTVEKTMGGTKIGTYKFMAPEVYNNQPYGMTADIYSLGLVLYWLLNERRVPFLPLPAVKSTAVVEEKARERRFRGEALPPPAHGSEKLKQIVLKACAFDPKDRYQTAAEMLTDLNAGEPAAIPEPPKPPVENHPAPVEVLIPNPQTEPEDAGDKTSYLWAKEQTEKVSDRTVLIAPDEKTPEAPKEKRNPVMEKMEETATPDSRKTIGGMKALGLFSVIAALIAGTLFWGYFNIHFWTEATCTEPETCKLCGITRGDLKHLWKNANCTEPETCSVCGKTHGNALGHIMVSATCSAAETCSVCGYTQGEPLAHHWTEATYFIPKTCTDCGITEGSKKPQIIQIDAGFSHTVGLREDGTVCAIGDNRSGQCDISDWCDIVYVSAGCYITAGLKTDGTVVVAGDCDDLNLDYVSDWTDIIAISADYYNIVGLKSDGTVLATGRNHHGECDVSHLSDIIAVATHSGNTLCLKSDGSVVMLGLDSSILEEWRNITAISMGNVAMGLKEDGTVVVEESVYLNLDETKEWKDIVEISAGSYYVVGRKNDGTVLIAGKEKLDGPYDPDITWSDALEWTDIVDISTCQYHLVGLKSDGTVVAVGFNDQGQCDVAELMK